MGLPRVLDMKHGLIQSAIALLSASFAQAQSDTAKLTTYTLPEVSVEHTRAQAGSGIAYTNLSQQQVRERNLGQDLPFLLQNTPSAVATSDAGTGIGYTYLRIRGTDATRTSVLLNGVPVNDAESQGTWFVNTPDLASAVQDVQVQRGVGTSNYGPGGFGASINLRTATTGMLPSVYLANSVGSWGTMKNTLVAGTGRLYNRFSAQIRLSQVASSGYVDRAAARLSSTQADLAYYGKRFKLNLLYLKGQERTYQAWYGVDEATLQTNRRYNLAGTDWGQKNDPYQNETDNYSQTHYQLHLDAGLAKNWSLQSTVFYTQGGGYYEQYKVKDTFATYGLDTLRLARGSTGPDGLIKDSIAKYGSSDFVRRRWLQNDFFGANASLHYAGQHHDLTLGAFASLYQGRNFGRIVWAQLAALPEPDYMFYNSPSRKHEVSLFARYRYQANGKLAFMADVQARRVSYHSTGADLAGEYLPFKLNWFFLNPKAGAEFTAGHTKTTLFAGITNREPTRASIITTSGGPPKAEQLFNLELGHQITGVTYHAGINLFYMHYKNQLVLTGETNNVGDPLMRNVERSFRRGIELDGQWRVHPGITLMGTLTLMQTGLSQYNALTTILNESGNYLGDSALSFNNKPIAYSPAQIATAIVQFKLLKSLTVELIGRYVSQQYLDNTGANDRSLNPYALADARLAWQPAVSGLKMLRITAQATNLLSTRYESNGYTGFTLVPTGGHVNYNYYFPQAPVTLLVGVELGF